MDLQLYSVSRCGVHDEAPTQWSFECGTGGMKKMVDLKALFWTGAANAFAILVYFRLIIHAALPTSSHSKQTILIYWMQTSRSSLQRCRQVERFIKGRHILDVGFWDHNDLWEHHAKAARSWFGIDFNDEPVRLAKEKGYEATKCALETHDLPKVNRPIDCILMRHVLEHIDAAGAFLLKLNET